MSMIFLNNRAMKKVLYSMMALFCFAIVSCEKEQTADNTETSPAEPFEFVLPANIPATLTASYIDTKTDYDADGKFSWTTGDQVAMMYVNDLSNPTSQGWVAYEVTSTSNEGRYATFSIVETADNQGRVTAMADYNSTGIAIYPASVARPSSGTSEYVSYGKPFFTKPSSIAGSASEVMLIGSPSSEDTPTDLKFSTAMAVLKISVSGIPSDAVSFGLYTADQDNYPIAGDYLLNIGGDKEVKLGDYTKYGSDHTGQAYLKASLSGSDAQTFYFNIPTGTYAANTISMKLLDANNNVLLEKTIKKEFTFNRNDLIEVGPYANEWVTLGTGKFIDNFLWGKLIKNSYTDALDKDVPGYVNVSIQQNASDKSSYRLVNPYGAAAAQFGYVPRETTTPDSYLYFSIASDGTVSFDTHITGVTLDARACNIELVCATSSYNQLLAGTQTSPEVIQLAPSYRYNGETAAYNQTGYKNMIHIVFPSALNDYIASMSASGSPTLSSVSVTASSKLTTRVTLSQYNDVQIASSLYSLSCNNYSTYPSCRANYKSNQSSLDWSSHVPETGQVYLSWFVIDESTYNVYSQGSVKVNAITAADVTKYVKTHTLNYGQTAAGEWKYGTITFELSDDLTKGQLILSDVDGMTSEASNTRLTADHPLWTAMGTWLAHGDGDYAYSADRVSDGNTYYGIISDGRLSFAANSNYEFFNYSVDGVTGHTAKIIIFSNDGSTSDAPQELAFDVSDTKLTLAHDYMIARWIGWYWNGSTVTNSGGYASQPLAQKDGDQRPYISLE